MRLSAAVRNDTGVYPGDGVVGHEQTAWYTVTTLRVHSGGIDISDLGAFPGDSLRFRVPNGIYAVEAKVIDFAGSFCVSRICARLQNKAGKLGRKRGQVPVDFAAIAIADFQHIRDELDASDLDELNEEACQFMTLGFAEKCSVRIRNRAIQFLVSRSGVGDGNYPVFSLRHKELCIGLEVEFFRDGFVLPYGG